MSLVQQGCLALGDITGYTKYLAGVELEHSQDVLADLMNVLVQQMRGLLHLAKLEGDAVFCYDHGGEADGATLLDMVHSCYFAFARRLRTIDRHTTCECNACRLIPTLNLKFLIHYGDFVVHEVAGSRELMGRDVIVVHRMLKSSFTQKTGLRGYAMFSEPCVQRFGFDTQTLAMIEHVESYEDVGEVRGYAMNLQQRWAQEEERRRVYIAPGEGLAVAEVDLPAPPPIVWHYLTSPRKRVLWSTGTQRVDEVNPSGMRGVGTTNHCVHGDFAVDEEILDWKPFQYYTDRSSAPFGVGVFTTELAPLGSNGTHVSVRMIPEGEPEAPEMIREMLPQLQHWYAEGTDALTRLLTEVQAEALERAGA